MIKAGPYWIKGHPDHDKQVQQVYTYFKRNVKWQVIMIILIMKK